LHIGFLYHLSWAFLHAIALHPEQTCTEDKARKDSGKA